MFKSREQLVSDALKTIDDKAKKSNRIVFANDVDEVENKDAKNNEQRLLFDDDENGEDEIDETFEFKIDEGRANKKLSKLQVNIGNDKRFALDYRFVDEEDIPKKCKSDEVDLQEEKKWELDILQNVLGKSINVQNESDNPESKGKKKMIRYDPTESNHRKYEVIVTKKRESNKVGKVKQTSNVTDVNDLPKVVSKNIFYTVSDNLVNCLQKEEKDEEKKDAEKEFSLLKAFGREISSVDDVPHDSRLRGKEKLQSTFDTNNPFKYDSSDNENPAAEDFESACVSNENKMRNDSSFDQHDDSFFFRTDDSRFNDAKQFFKKHSMSQEKFHNLRCELKQIVRKKIRKNLKKSLGWNRKRKL